MLVFLNNSYFIYSEYAILKYTCSFCNKNWEDNTMKKNRCKYMLCAFGLLFHTLIYAQYNFSGSVVNPQKEVLPGATIMLYAADSLMGGTITDAKGLFELKNLPKNECRCIISMLGYQMQEHSINLAQQQQAYSFILQEDAEELDVLTVEADRRDLVKAGTGYTSYTLSSQALKTKSAYESLREIPQLIIDESNRTIRLSSGETPVILINGVNRPGYFDSLDPEMIESVEVIENPSAKYRGEQAVSKILSIKIKREREKSYLNGNLYSRHNVEAVYGVSGLSLGADNSKYSLYLTAQQFYFHNDDVDFKEYTETSGIIRDLSQQQRFNTNMISANVGGDWVISDKDYLSWAVSFVTNPNDINKTSSGTITDLAADESAPLTARQSTDNHYYMNTYNLYYKHTFPTDNYLEIKGGFGWFGSGAQSDRVEESALSSYKSVVDLDNKKKSLNVDINYDWQLSDKLKMDFGANTYMQHSSIEDVGNNYPIYHYKDLREYIFGDLSHSVLPNLSYQLSLGVDFVFTNADGIHNRYVTFVPGASVTYNLNQKSFFQLYFSRQRTSPDISLLNPRNTSADSLMLIQGNPYLKPYVDNTVNLSYTWNHKGIYLSPFVLYDYSAKQISDIGYMEGNRYVQTYENLDNLQQLRTGINTRFNLSTFGNLNMSVYYQKDFIEGMPFSGNNWGANASSNLFYKKVSLYAYLFYGGYRYSKTSKSFSTPESEMIFTWNLPKNWALTAGLRYFAAGDNHLEETIKDAGYYYHSVQKFTDRYLMPMIGISYTLKNKVQQKRYQQQRLYNSDSGIGSIKVK